MDLGWTSHAIQFLRPLIRIYSTLLYLAFPAVEGTEVAAALASAAAAAADVAAAVGGSVAVVVVAG